MSPPFHINLGKTAALEKLARIAGVVDLNAWGGGAEIYLTRLIEVIPPYTNIHFKWCPAGEMDLDWISHHDPAARTLRQPDFLNGRPACFGPVRQIHAFSPGFRLLDLRDGAFAHLFGAPISVHADRRTIVADASSRYSRLLQYYDFSLDDVVTSARQIDGTAIVISDDIRPLNFSHWILDWLPRLAFLGIRARQPDTFVVTTPLVADFQRQSLEMCGFTSDRIIELEEFSAIRARQLLVPADIPTIPHPTFKAAPWAVSYLRDTLGLASFRLHRGTEPPRKLYVSRADAGRRRVSNDADLSAMLASRGYTHITLSNLKLSEQIYLFSNATHIISLHGAGLSNLVFCGPGTRVIEVFPESYGTPAFYALAGALDLRYHTYVAKADAVNPVPQYHDALVDVAAFRDLAGHLL